MQGAIQTTRKVRGQRAFADKVFVVQFPVRTSLNHQRIIMGHYGTGCPRMPSEEVLGSNCASLITLIPNLVKNVHVACCMSKKGLVMAGMDKGFQKGWRVGCWGRRLLKTIAYVFPSLCNLGVPQTQTQTQGHMLPFSILQISHRPIAGLSLKIGKLVV